jgi:hypothetical protein
MVINRGPTQIDADINGQVKKDKLAAILRDFEETGLYEDNFLQDLEEGLNKSSIYR